VYLAATAAESSKGQALVLHGGLFKRIKAERLNIRFGIQATNILNHPNWVSALLR
jgi:hypothetical protein